MEAKKETKYLIIEPVEGQPTRDLVLAWLKQQGGSMPLGELQTQVLSQFNTFNIEICSENEATNRNLLNTAYRLVGNIVFLPREIALGSLLEQ